MKPLFRPSLALVALAFFVNGQAQNNKTAKTAPAASSQSPSQPSEQRITLDVSRVNMLYTVSDKKGRFVTDLTKDDFEVFESKKPQTIIEFAAESDLPLRLAILIDTSNSIRDRFHFQQEAAIAFIDGTVRPEQDKAHDCELRYRGRAGGRSDRRRSAAREGGRRVCGRAAGHRFMTPFSSPPATS